MNIKEELTCKYCNEIYSNPIMLNCCGENICRQHIDELISNNSSNKFTCPLCNEENANENFCVNKLIDRLVQNELHKLVINSKYKDTLEIFTKEVRKLEAVLINPENFIYDEISELKRQVDLNREDLKSKIDTLADDVIDQLRSYEKMFRQEYKSKFAFYDGLLESSRRQLADYEKFLNLFSVTNEERERKTKESLDIIDNLKPKIKEIKEKLFSNLSITFERCDNDINNLFGKLIIKKKKEFLGAVKKTLDEKTAALAVLPNGDLASGGSNYQIKIWDINSGTVKQTLNGHTAWINDVKVLDINSLISASSDMTIKIWNISQGTVKTTLSGHTKSVLTLKVLEGGRLASGSADTTIKVWNLNDEKVKHTFKGHTKEVCGLVVLNNGDLASASSDKTIKIWDVETGSIKQTLSGHENFVYVLALLQNGDLVSGSWDKTIKIWNVEDGTVKRTLTGHISFIFAFKVLDNGDLVSGSYDRIKVWDVETGTVKKDICVNSKVNSLEVLQNGDLVSASSSSIIIWE